MRFRRSPLPTGRPVAYQWVEVASFERETLPTQYPNLLPWFSQYEVPADFRA